MDKQAILEEIAAYYMERSRSNEMQPSDVTYDDVKEVNHIGHSAAQRLMKELVQMGMYERIELRVGNVRKVVFRRVHQ